MSSAKFANSKWRGHRTPDERKRAARSRRLPVVGRHAVDRPLPVADRPSTMRSRSVPSGSAAAARAATPRRSARFPPIAPGASGSSRRAAAESRSTSRGRSMDLGVSARLRGAAAGPGRESTAPRAGACIQSLNGRARTDKAFAMMSAPYACIQPVRLIGWRRNRVQRARRRQTPHGRRQGRDRARDRRQPVLDAAEGHRSRRAGDSRRTQPVRPVARHHGVPEARPRST